MLMGFRNGFLCWLAKLLASSVVFVTRRSEYRLLPALSAGWVSYCRYHRPGRYFGKAIQHARHRRLGPHPVLPRGFRACRDTGTGDIHPRRHQRCLRAPARRGVDGRPANEHRGHWRDHGCGYHHTLAVIAGCPADWFRAGRSLPPLPRLAPSGSPWWQRHLERHIFSEGRPNVPRLRQFRAPQLPKIFEGQPKHVPIVRRRRQQDKHIRYFAALRRESSTDGAGLDPNPHALLSP